MLASILSDWPKVHEESKRGSKVISHQVFYSYFVLPVTLGVSAVRRMTTLQWQRQDRELEQ